MTKNYNIQRSRRVSQEKRENGKHLPIGSSILPIEKKQICVANMLMTENFKKQICIAHMLTITELESAVQICFAETLITTELSDSRVVEAAAEIRQS